MDGPDAQVEPSEPPPRPASGAPTPLRPRFQSFVLVKVIVALVLALLVSATLTSAVAAHLTRTILADESQALGKGQLNILREAYAEREQALTIQLRNLAQTFNARGLYTPQNRPELIAELGRVSANLDLAVLRVLDHSGRELDPPAGIGQELAEARSVPIALSPGWSSGAGELHEQSTRLLLTKGGTYAQVLWVGTVVGERNLILLGGYSFDDSFAFRLRKQIGDTGEILLVVDGRVAGSTFVNPPLQAPGSDNDSLPRSPTVVRIGDSDRMVAYAPVGTRDDARDAIGLLLADPIARLNRSLAQARLITVGLLAAITLIVAGLLFRTLIRPLAQLARTAIRITAGDLDERFHASTRDEVGMLARTLEAMRAELQDKLRLVEKQANELRASSQRIVAAADQERHRLAGDLHDGLQQQLVVLRMKHGLAAEDVADHVVVERFEELGSELDAVIERLREVTQNVYPSILVDRGLLTATRSYIGRLPVYARLTAAPEPFPRLTPEIEGAAYFLLGEAVTNSLKHAAATEIVVSLAVVDQWLIVTVTDDGHGFAVDAVERRGGLLHMQDRARSLGGELRITSCRDAGTEIVATFALPQAHARREPTESLVDGVTPRSVGERKELQRPAG